MSGRGGWAGFSRHALHPTGRDLALLRLVGERGVVSRDTLLSAYWPGSSTPRTGHDRLAQIVGAGWLHVDHLSPRGGEEILYTLGRSGALLLPPDDRGSLITTRPAYGEMAHLLRTGDLLDRLHARYTLLGWQPERRLKADAQRGGPGKGGPVADCLVQLQTPLLGRTTWLIEVDGAYYGVRLSAKIAALGVARTALLWVVYTPGRLARLESQAAPFASIRPVLFSAL